MKHFVEFLLQGESYLSRQMFRSFDEIYILASVGHMADIAAEELGKAEKPYSLWVIGWQYNGHELGKKK